MSANAKWVKFYATNPRYFIDVDEKIVKQKLPFIIPVYHVADAKEFSEEKKKLVFDRIGEYRVRTFIHSEKTERSFASHWIYPVNVKLIHYDPSWEVFEKEQLSICTERVLVSSPGQEADIGITPKETNKLFNVLIVLEHLST